MGNRTKILEATEKLLAERGFYGLSMKVLADTAGIVAGTIYRYFENKEMLMLKKKKENGQPKNKENGQPNF